MSYDVSAVQLARGEIDVQCVELILGDTGRERADAGTVYTKVLIHIQMRSTAGLQEGWNHRCGAASES